MSFLTRFAVGYNGSDVRFVGPDEVAWVCGNTLLLQSTASSRQRFLKGTSFGIQCFAVNLKQGLIAFSEKGPNPSIRIYASATLTQIAVVKLQSELGYTALAFSTDGDRLAICSDEPECAVNVYLWRQGESVVQGKLPCPARMANFHPANSDMLVTTGGGHQAVWHIEKLWDKNEFVHRQVMLGAHEPSCHAWAPQALYSGTMGGQMFAVDLVTMQPLVANTVDRAAEQRRAARLALVAALGGVDGTAAAGADGGGGDRSALDPSPIPPSTTTTTIGFADQTMSALQAEASSGGEAPAADRPPAPRVCFQASSSGSPVTAIGLNRDVVLVGSLDLAAKILTHGSALAPFEMRHDQPFSALGIASLEFGGEEFDHAVIGARDGTVWLAHLRHDMSSVLSCTTLCDCHVGPVTGVVPHPGEPILVTTGTDGSLRLWDAASGHLISKRTFSSAQTCLAAAKAKPFVGLGSATGVVRLVSLMDGVRPLSVLFRRRLHSAAVTAVAFSPSSTMMASAGKDGTLWFVSLPVYGQEAAVLGHVLAPEPVLSLSWPMVADGEDCVLVSLVSGGIMCVTTPSHRARRPGALDAMVTQAAAAAAGTLSAPSQDMQLGTRENVTIKVLKIEMPLLNMVSVPGERYGDLYGLGADKLVHRLVLPTEGQAWAGLKGRLHKSTLKVPAHSMPGAALSVCGTGLLMCSGSMDGTVLTRSPALHETGSLEGGVGLHDSLAGGVLSISFDTTGRYFMSAGADGCLFIYEVRGTGHVGRPHPIAPGLPAEEDLDLFDDAGEDTEIDVAKRQNAEMVLAAGDEERMSVAKRLGTLRRQLLEAVKQNEQAPPLEQAERSAFIIDSELVSELKLAANARVAGVRELVKRQHLRLDFIAGRVKQVCWDHMQTRGIRITGMRMALEVVNFAVSTYSDARMRKVAYLRRVEQAEHRQLGVMDGSRHYRVTLDGHGVPVGPSHHGHHEDGHDDDHQAAAGAASFASTAATNRFVDTAGGDNEFGDAEGAMYSDFDLNTAARKTAQIHFYRHSTQTLMTKFNVEFAKIAKQKKTDSDRIADLNGRIDETLRDLLKLGGTFPALDPAQGAERFTPAFPEEMDNVMRVLDAEVLQERYVSEEEFSKGELARRTEEDGVNKKQRDNALDRAIRQMMGGTLAGGRAEEADAFKLERPEWMDTNPKLFTEEQTKMSKEWMVKDKVLQDEKAKRVNMLQMELRTMSTTMDEVSVKFDEALVGLAGLRLQASVAVAALETRIMAMASNIDRCSHTSDIAEKELHTLLATLKDRKTRVSADLAEKRSLAASLVERTTVAQADERLLDRNFKKEFIDSEGYYSRMLQLYRYRVLTAVGPDGQPVGPPRAAPAPVVPLAGAVSEAAEAAAAASAQASMSTTMQGDPSASMRRLSGTGQGGMGQTEPSLAESSSSLSAAMAAAVPLVVVVPRAELDPFPEPPIREIAEEVEVLDNQHKPDGLDISWWDKLVGWRANKVRSEADVRTSSANLAVVRKDMPVLEAEDLKLDQELEHTVAALAELKSGRISALYDVDMQLKLKAGQVETAPTGMVSCDNKHAVFLHRGVVEGVNSHVLAKGGKKVEILTAIKDFKKGIYDLEWQHLKYDMLIHDLKNKTRELQLLHVTRDIQTVFKEGEDRSNSQEMANLEVLGRQREKLHDKAIVDKQRKLRKVAGDMHGKAAQNGEVSAHLVTLQRVLEEQQRLQQSMQSLDDVATRRMRSMVTHKKLAEISGAQRSEIGALANELEKLRLRTYPTFPEPSQMAMVGHRALTPPDLKKLPPMAAR